MTIAEFYIVSGWRLWLARLFGERIERNEEGYIFVAHWWRGKLYVEEFRPDAT